MANPQISAEDLRLLAQYDTPTICNTIELVRGAPARHGLHGRPHPRLLPGDAAHRGLRLHGHVPRRHSRARRARPTARSTTRCAPSGSCPGRPSWCSRTWTIRPWPPPSAKSCAPPTSASARRADHQRRRARPGPGAAAGLLRRFRAASICSHGYSSILAIHKPVRVGGVAVHPGDLLHADANGVTTIPLEIASEVAACRGRIRRRRSRGAGFPEDGIARRGAVFRGAPGDHAADRRTGPPRARAARVRVTRMA